MVENLSPGMVCPVVIQRDDDLVVEKMTWGLIPAYVPVSDKPNHFALFNKRTDSLFACGYFRKLVESKRCLIVLDGFYEWKTVSGKTKQPYYVSCGDEPLQIAGIYERSKRIDALGNTVIFPTFSMLTGDSSAKFTALHHREPVLLTDGQALRWLDTEKADLDDLLRELVRNPQNSGLAINSDLGFYPVTSRVGKASYQEPDCTAPVAAADRPAGVRSIDSFFKSPSRAPAESSPSSARKTKRTHEGPSSPSSSSPPSPAKKAKRGTIKDFFGK